ncbi:MAG: hypothetical protein ACOCXH_08705 [Cyclobacteriaceae bacterium]
MPESRLNEIEKQLHEQYAINNNSKLSAIITLIVALLSIIGIYGNVFVNSSIDFASKYGEFSKTTGGCKCLYPLDVLILATIATYFVIIVIYYLSSFTGANQRKEQFIAYAIRRCFYLNNFDNDRYNMIFPEKYSPFFKRPNNFVQGLYGEISKILKYLFGLITLATLGKIVVNILEAKKNINEYTISLENTFILSISFIATLIILCVIKHTLFKEYKKREQEFLEKSLFLENKGTKSLKISCISKFCFKICRRLSKIIIKLNKLSNCEIKIRNI